MADEQSFETKQEAAGDPLKAVRRWLLELKLAQKREKDWRKIAKEILDRYRGKNRKKNSFNILWANTETLRPALYNSPPKPDVRRRFRQNDMLGKAVAEVSERSLSYCVDAYDLDQCIKNDVLDALLPGRGLSRVRYVPKLTEAPQPAPVEEETPEKPSRIKRGFFGGEKAAESPAPATGEASEGEREEVEYQQALCDHVQWDDFLQGPGKTWDEVPWVGFRHRLTKDDQVEKFGEEIANQIKQGDVAEPDLEGDQNKDIAGVFKRAEFWEIWDKDSKRVFFVNESYKKGLIFPVGETGTPPLKLKEFFPCPRPLMLVEDSGSLIPIPLYELYREQADELDRISTRINKVVAALKVRGVFDATLSEMKTLMDGDDNELIPAAQARVWMTNGGLEKAIWWMPVEQSAKVLKELYLARDSAKMVIYEITGISDIIRGAQTKGDVTATEQQIKANYASLRLQRMQREVQRYVRDLIRLLAEVIGEHFDQQTLGQMTGLQFPTMQQKQMLMMQAQGAQQQGQPIPQPLQNALQMPAWEEVMAVLRSDMQREFRVDVETNSTVAESLNADMEGLKEVLTGLVEFWTGCGPAVASGALSIEAVKQISMTIVRRAKMGLEVEDALESGMQQPKPQDDGEAAKAEAEKQKIAQKAQADAAKLAHEQQMAQQKAAAEEHALQMKDALERQRMEYERQAQERKDEIEAAYQRFKALLDAQTKVDVAEIAADASVQAAKEKPAPQAVQ